MITVGWLLLYDDTGISLANERDESGGWRGHTFVPTGMIWGVRLVTSQPEHKWLPVDKGV